MKEMLISELAEAAEVSVQTIRYYERRSLVPEPPRSDGGYRLYPPNAVQRVRFIRRAKELGFTLDEIQDLLELRVRHGEACDDVERQAKRTMARIDEQMLELRRMKKALSNLIRKCDRNETTGECPIIESLEGDDDEYEHRPDLF